MSRPVAPRTAAEGDPAAEYRAARETAIVADLAGRGRLRISGADAFDLMHRLTTNSIRDLASGEGRPAIFATAKGRIIDLVLFHRFDEELLCTTGEGRAGVVVSWIDRYTFREDVRVEDRSATHCTIGIYGTKAADVVSILCPAVAAGWAAHHAARFNVEGIEGVLARTYPLAGEGFLATVTAERGPALIDRLLERHAGMRVAGPAALEALRIEAGMPAPERELTEDYNPWEAGLGDAVSLDKGCYVGQEVIARLDTYSKVSKNLVRLKIAGPDVPPRGSALEIAGRRTGTLTSVAAVPGEDRIIGLGYVQDEHAESGMELHVAAPGGGIGATVEGPAR